MTEERKEKRIIMERRPADEILDEMLQERMRKNREAIEYGKRLLDKTKKK